MIGPHQGRELELMLAGKKHLAVFSDAVPTDGVISEEIIPEIAFTPHVKSGFLLRYEKDIFAKKTNSVIRYVCFTTNFHTWRAETFFWIKELTLSQEIAWDDAFEKIIGRLLGYSEYDIDHYINHSRLLSSTVGT